MAGPATETVAAMTAVTAMAAAERGGGRHPSRRAHAQPRANPATPAAMRKWREMNGGAAESPRMRRIWRQGGKTNTRET